MKIQINTDKTINGDKRHEVYYVTQISEALKRYESHITRIEVHLKDENGKKDGLNDMYCLIEARMEGQQPIVVSNHANTIDIAIDEALVKLQASLKTKLGRLQRH